MKGFLFKSINGNMEFTSQMAYALFKQDMKDNPGRQYRIEVMKKPVSSNLRAYYFGAVLPEVRKTCEAWRNLSTEEIHQIIKKMLFYFETLNPITKRIERFGRSVMADDEWNNTAKAMKFLEVVAEYLESCGHDMPDSEEYKRERDLAPTK